MRYLILIIFIFSVGCAHIPPETARLSAEVTREIADSRIADHELVNMLTDEMRLRYGERLRWIYTPRLIVKVLEHPKMKKKFREKICKNDGLDRAVFFQQIVERLSKKIEKKKREWFDPIDKIGRDLHRDFDVRYDRMELMSRTVDANIQSVVKGRKMQKQILDSIENRSEVLRSIKAAKEKLERELKIRSEESAIQLEGGSDGK